MVGTILYFIDKMILPFCRIVFCMFHAEGYDGVGSKLFKNFILFPRKNDWAPPPVIIIVDR